MRPPELRGEFLLLDAAGPLVQTGLWREGAWLHWTASREEAGRGLFAGVSEILNIRGISVADLSGFFFCEGPGSMLGVRIAAMAIQGWQAIVGQPLPLFVYQSHELLARRLLASGESPPFAILSDARRDRWNVTTVDKDGIIQPLRRIASDQLAESNVPFFRMEEPIRNDPPVSVARVPPYDLESAATFFLEPGFLRPADTPEPFVQEKPAYRKWSAERHR